ncbi:MAG: hypothetical protein ACI823_001228 [Chitinophagales bacterium]|jgi:hypothetical protein
MCITNNVSNACVSKKLAIWNVPSYQLCTLIGYCIDVSYIRKLRKRFPTITADIQGETDYELHAFCVNACLDKNLLSTHLNKYLKRSYQTSVSALRQHKTDEAVEAFWRSIDLNDDHLIAGFCWALLTSQYASPTIKQKLYGEIHMLSHISGQGLRTEQKKLTIENCRLLQEQPKQARALLRQQARYENQQEITKSLENKIIDLKQRLLVKDEKTSDLSDSQANELFKNYEKTIWSQHLQMVKLQEKLKLQEHQYDELKASQLNNTKLEINTTNSGTKVIPFNSDLCGKSILYVGGFSRHKDRFKQLIESINGQFLYHDGGMQQSNHLLNMMVKKADAVFCPIDCISHGAVGRIKSLTKTECKDCIFLRSPSLTSFKKEVMQYAS